MNNIYTALVHGPIKNKRGEKVTTSVTNLDIHDIARSCRTFGMKQYFIVTPIKAQQELVGRITSHWASDEGNEYNPDRSDALAYIQLVNTVDEAILSIEKVEGKKPIIAVTGANFDHYDGNCAELLERMHVDNRPMLLLFGTGWGLHASILEQAEYHVTPIFGSASDGYNHLSVRSAVAIYLNQIAEASESNL